MRSELSVDIATVETDSFALLPGLPFYEYLTVFSAVTRNQTLTWTTNSRCRKEQSTLGATTGYQSIKSCSIQGSCRRAVSVVLK